MRKLFKERKLFKGGNYMRKYGWYIDPRITNTSADLKSYWSTLNH